MLSLKEYNSFAVSAYADQLYLLDSPDQLTQILPLLRGSDNKLILGAGSNILLTGDFKGPVVINRLRGMRVIEDVNDSVLVEVAAGENWHAFVCWCVENGYHGLENLSLIPGNVGASPIQNIGAYGVEIAQYIDSITAVDIHGNRTILFENRDCEFAYRDSIFRQSPDHFLITTVRFRLSRKFSAVTDYSGVREKLEEEHTDPRTVTAQQLCRIICALRSAKLPDPSVIGNAGSFFKNPVLSADAYFDLRRQHAGIPAYRTTDSGYKIPAAWLIEQCGFKGYRVGDAGVYEHHALVLVNYGRASGDQIWNLAKSIRSSVAGRFGIILEPEPRIL